MWKDVRLCCPPTGTGRLFVWWAGRRVARGLSWRPLGGLGAALWQDRPEVIPGLWLPCHGLERIGQ